MSTARLAWTRRAASSTSRRRLSEIPFAAAAGIPRAGLRAGLPPARAASDARESVARGRASTGSCALPPTAEAFGHVPESLLRRVEDPVSGGFDLKVPFRPSAPLRRRFAGIG